MQRLRDSKRTQVFAYMTSSFKISGIVSDTRGYRHSSHADIPRIWAYVWNVPWFNVSNALVDQRMFIAAQQMLSTPH
jgi:hypothetical protein